MIEVLGLTKKYGEKIVLKNLNFKVERGEIFSLIGPNGAGKTTLLRLINLLETPTSGKIYFFGEDTSRKNVVELRRRMTMVFQNPTVFNESVYKNIAYGLKIRGFSKKIVAKRVEEVLKLVKLEEFERENALKLSGGEQQRVALARAIAVEPELLILDEPTANLDPKNVKIIEETVSDINKKTTILFATHNMFQAKRLASKCAFLYEGKILEIGTPEKIFGSPENEKTLSFVRGEI